MATYDLQVYIVDVQSEEFGQTVVAELKKEYPNSEVHYVLCDITDYEAFKGMFIGSRNLAMYWTLATF